MKRIFILAKILVAAVSCVSNKYIKQVDEVKSSKEKEVMEV